MDVQVGIKWGEGVKTTPGSEFLLIPPRGCYNLTDYQSLRSCRPLIRIARSDSHRDTPLKINGWNLKEHPTERKITLHPPPFFGFQPFIFRGILLGSLSRTREKILLGTMDVLLEPPKQLLYERCGIVK